MEFRSEWDVHYRRGAGATIRIECFVLRYVAWRRELGFELPAAFWFSKVVDVSTEELEHEALKLSPCDRARLANRLLESL